MDINHQVISQLPAKPVGHDQKRRTMVANQMRELLTQYGRIDLFWFDGGSGEISNDEIRKLQPGIETENLATMETRKELSPPKDLQVGSKRTIRAGPAAGGAILRATGWTAGPM